jgi:O-methyltransferase involved in polyketide biosynthesis
MGKMDPFVPPEIAASLAKPSAARIYDYWLGGSHNYAVDRKFSREQVERFVPDIPTYARENRKALQRAVRYALGAGIRQFVDIGCGLPTAGHVHEIADGLAPGEASVVYVDNEPLAAAHAEQILLAETADPDRHKALYGDLLTPAELWPRIVATGVIDPDRPTALLMVAVLHFCKDETHPYEVVAHYRDRLAPGSLLVASHFSSDDVDSPQERAAYDALNLAYERTTNPGQMRGRAEFAGFFGDFALVEPGIVYTPQWRPDDPADWTGRPSLSRMFFGVGRKEG